jgi:bifunctional UDP-N-acetylglucosamine pyrophosphorylase/glucosamine-1-phosphate N-acetyltransferase
VIYPGSIIAPNCTVGENCVIGPDTWLENTVVENGAKVISTRAVGVTVPAGGETAPFSVLLPPPPQPEPAPQPEEQSKKRRRHFLKDK